MAIAITLAALAPASCVLLDDVTSSSGKSTKADIQQQIGPGGVTPAEIQSDIMSFADNYAELVEQALTESVTEYVAKRPDLRQRAIVMKLDMIQGAITIAAEANPVTAMLDLAVMVSLQREVWEEYWVPQVWGEAGAPLTEALQTLEAAIWEIVADALDENEMAALRELIRQVREQYPNQVLVTGLRASEFAQDRQQTFVKIKGGGGLLSLFNFDPLRGLSPATREIHQARLLGERAFFYAKRLPNLVRWQAEALAGNVFSYPEIQSLVISAQAASDAMAQLQPMIAELQSSLPAERDTTLEMIEERFTRIRDETIASVQTAIATEREALFTDIENAPAQVGQTLTELRETMTAAQALSTNLTGLVTDLDGLAKTLRLDQPPADGAKGMSAADFERINAETARTVTELRMLIDSAHQLIDSPQAQRIVDRTETLGQSMIDRVFNKALILIGALGLSLFLALAASRLVGSRASHSTRA